MRMIKIPKWLSTATVAATMFLQSMLLPTRALAPNAVSAAHYTPEPVKTESYAPDRAPARADVFMQAPQRPAAEQASQPAVAGQADVPTQPSGGNAADTTAPAPAVHKGKTVAIDPGHGGHDPGAVHKGADGQADVTEEDANLAVALKLADMLRADGYDVVLTRSQDADVVPGGSTVAELQARVDAANEAGADVLVSVHFNGLDNPEARGTEVWYCSQRPQGADNERLATAVQESLVRNLNEAGFETVDRGIKNDSVMGHFAITGPDIARPSQMPAIIGEPLFMTNDQDAATLKSPQGQEALARGYFQGIQAYFGDAS
jgi:N-acetylmuramoyl-L-alanine amidase